MSEMIGGCFCGEVRYHCDAPAKWCAHCHCGMCRRTHGAAFVTWLGFPNEAFKITAGVDQLKWFESSEGARRGFCSHCGTTLFFESSRWAGEMHITEASFDQEPEQKPQSHAFYDTHRSWLKMDDGLPRRGGPSGTEPLPDAG